MPILRQGGNKLSEALARLAIAPGFSIRQLAKALASYKKDRKKKWKKIEKRKIRKKRRNKYTIL